MKIKLKTPDRHLLAFNRRELTILSNCLNEACHGLLMDRFIPAHDELVEMLDSVRSYALSQELFSFKTRKL